MGMSSTVELKVRTFSEAAKKRVMEISLKDYTLHGQNNLFQCVPEL